MANSTVSLNGRVEKTDIPTLLRSVEKDKLSGELRFVRRDNQRINLYFLFGQLYHSEWGDVVGIDAVSELLSWKEGNFSFSEGVIPTKASINDDIDRILATKSPEETSFSKPAAALPPTFNAPAPPAEFGRVNTGSLQPFNPESMFDAQPFDLASLNTPASTSQHAVPPQSTVYATPVQNFAPSNPPQANYPADSGYNPMSINEPDYDSRIAPAPPANGLYRTRYFCLPAGEQMSTSLVATGPQLEEELLHLSEVGFTGYLLGGPEIEGMAAVGICLLKGRFIHAFAHLNTPNGMTFVEGEKAYRSALDMRGGESNRFYWFYELTGEVMRSAIALLTPPTRYAHLEVRIVRFKELLKMLSEEMHTGCVRITVPTGKKGTGTLSPLAGDRAYLPVYQGQVMGVWTEFNPKLTNDGQLLQRFLAEPLAFLDLHATTPVAEPGMPLESLISARPQEPLSPPSQPNVLPPEMLKPNTPVSVRNAVMPPEPTEPPLAKISDEERQMQLISSISRMESTWVQMQRKDKTGYHDSLLALAGFANEIISLNESTGGRKLIQEMIARSLRQELTQFRGILTNLDLPQGRISIIKILKEYETFSRENDASAQEYYRESGRALRALIRSGFQNFISFIHKESIRFECQEMFEVFLNEVVKRI
jgi:hypothetical protein